MKSNVINGVITDKILPNRLIVTIGPPKGGHRFIRGYTAWSMDDTYIGITLQNVCKDLEDINNIDEWAEAIDALFLIELICAHVVRGNWWTGLIHPCKDLTFCPIANVVKKIGYKYEINENSEEFIK